MKKIVISSIISIFISVGLSCMITSHLDEKVYSSINFWVEKQWKLEEMISPIQTPVNLKFSSNNFASVYTSPGAFPISVEGISQYGTGSRISLNIGNIYFATISSFSIKVQTKGKDTDKQITTVKSFSNPLQPGSWNLVTVDIPEFAPNQLKDSFSLSLDVDQISLSKNAN